jgi:ubiquinone/menaquinone biosynthesis C-methylase UbiE
MSDPREATFERWERAAVGWRKRAEEVRDHGMAVSIWMVDHLALQPGQRVLELAAGPGDTGFLAAELIKPGGVLISSDGSEAMLSIARERAEQLGIDNVEFKRLELEWIDLDTASVDAVLCRWGVMLSSDPAAALHEVRRVVRPGGRFALAVWDEAERNPWATIPGAAMIELGHSDPPDPSAPGMFTLASPGRLQEMLEAAGFVEVLVESVQLDRRYESFEAFFEETLDLSLMFAEPYKPLEAAQQRRVRDRMTALLEPYTGERGVITLPGASLAALANA